MVRKNQYQKIAEILKKAEKEHPGELAGAEHPESVMENYLHKWGNLDHEIEKFAKSLSTIGDAVESFSDDETKELAGKIALPITENLDPITLTYVVEYLANSM
jgi:hypothetical protein